MHWLKRIDQLIMRVEKWMISWSIIGMTVILLANVVARSIFNNSLSFAEEVGQFFIILVTFIGVSYCARWGRHLKMTALAELLPYKVRKGIFILITITTSILMFYLSYLGVRYVGQLFMFERMTPALRLPMYLIILFVPIGFFFGGIQYLHECYLNIRYKEMIDGTQDESLKEGGTQ